MSRDELIKIVEQIMSVEDENGNDLTEEEHHNLVLKFKKILSILVELILFTIPNWWVSKIMPPQKK